MLYDEDFQQAGVNGPDNFENTLLARTGPVKPKGNIVLPQLS